MVNYAGLDKPKLHIPKDYLYAAFKNSIQKFWRGMFKSLVNRTPNLAFFDFQSSATVAVHGVS